MLLEHTIVVVNFVVFDNVVNLVVVFLIVVCLVVVNRFVLSLCGWGGVWGSETRF